jgi:hypothetical protein
VSWLSWQIIERMQFQQLFVVGLSGSMAVREVSEDQLQGKLH